MRDKVRLHISQFIIAFTAVFCLGPGYAVEPAFHSSCEGAEEYYVKRTDNFLSIIINGLSKSITIKDQLTSISEYLRAGKNTIRFSYNRDMDNVNISFIHECNGAREKIFHEINEVRESERPSVSVSGRESVSFSINTNYSENHVAELAASDKEAIREILKERFRLISESRFREAHNLCHKIEVDLRSKFPELDKEQLDFFMSMGGSGEGDAGFLDPDGRIAQELDIDKLSYIVTPSLVIVHRPNNKPLYSVGREGGGETRVKTEKFQRRSGEWVCVKRKAILERKIQKSR